MDVGVQLGPYTIIAPIGEGGMGEVWRARDERLHRDVAIKLVRSTLAGSPATLARFEREARAVAALSHPNILAIHDFGSEGETVYAVMELLEGDTLRDRLRQEDLPLPRVLDWGHQVAQGLAAAHEKGVVHRDLKPENVFVTRDGVVKILDFGLARLDRSEHALVGKNATTLAKTTPGAIIGTVAYLSPEQARGETADHRSDIFAFGAVLSEMLTGQPAFLRESTADTIVAVLRESPRALSGSGKNVPGEVEEILQHCLEKRPEERFRSARDLAFALRLAMRTSSSSSPAPEPTRQTPRIASGSSRTNELSIAVLPFRNLSPAPDAEYFSDGMTEEIISALSSVPALRVAARTSSFAFKNKVDDVRRIGGELGVAMVLEGSVRQAGSRLRVSAQLVNVESGYDMWSKRWDRELADVFAVQDEIAEAIASTLKLRLMEGTEAGSAGKTQIVEAYDHYLKGRYLLGKRHAAEAIAELESAVERDPDFADAHTTLADAWAVRGFYGGLPAWEAWARARSAVDDAQRIAPDAPGGALSLAILEHYYGWNSGREEELCRLAIERSPQSAAGWNWLAICLASSGRRDEALAAGARGIELEPLDANVRTSQAWAHLYAGEPELAVPLLEKAIAIDSNAGYALWTYGVALRFSGRVDESVRHLDRIVEASNRKVPFYLSLLGGALAAAGERATAESILAELDLSRREGRFVPSIDRATILVALGDHDAALDALERAREERNALTWGRIYWSDFVPLRSTPRWQALARSLGRTAPFSGTV